MKQQTNPESCRGRREKVKKKSEWINRLTCGPNEGSHNFYWWWMQLKWELIWGFSKFSNKKLLSRWLFAIFSKKLKKKLFKLVSEKVEIVSTCQVTYAVRLQAYDLSNFLGVCRLWEQSIFEKKNIHKCRSVMYKQFSRISIFNFSRKNSWDDPQKSSDRNIEISFNLLTVSQSSDFFENNNDEYILLLKNSCKIKSFINHYL